MYDQYLSEINEKIWGSELEVFFTKNFFWAIFFGRVKIIQIGNDFLQMSLISTGVRHYNKSFFTVKRNLRKKIKICKK